jgi:hypothetical protein
MPSSTRRPIGIVAIANLFALIAVVALAQSTFATLTGTVVDSSGASSRA